MEEEIVLMNGKYRFYRKFDNSLKDSLLHCDRYGEPWRDFLGDHAVNLLFDFALDMKKKSNLKEDEMDADNRIIPIVEDDQGEGFKDPLDKHDLEKMSEFEKKIEKLRRRTTQEEHSRRFKG